MKKTNLELRSIHALLNSISEFNIPCGMGITMNIKRLEAHNEQVQDQMDSICEKYLTVVEGSEYRYKRIDEQGKNADYTNYDAGDQQEEYLKDMQELLGKEVDFEFHNIKLGRKIIDAQGNEMTLADMIDTKYTLPPKTLAPLMGCIFVE